MLSGITTSIKEMQFKNALLGMFVRLLDRVIFSNDVQSLKASLPIDIIESDIITFLMFSQPEKA